tara:strand:+ start:677 stop:1165 length:489 start_codon:yes stop_codon:yes gene_type:complete
MDDDEFIANMMQEPATIWTSKGKPATLTLENGEQFTGFSFGADVCGNGEVVFNTSMTGYPETLTDPSYEGQMLVLTYPLIGNYGVPGKDRDEHGLLKYFESERIHVTALIVSDYSEEYSHWNARHSLSSWLKESGIPAITGVDTRKLTKILREVKAEKHSGD